MKNKNFINAFKKINVSNNLERKILNMTINNEKNYKMRRLAHVTLFLLLFGCISLSCVYAGEIKNLIKNWSLKIGLGDEQETVVDSKNKIGSKIISDDIKQNEIFAATTDVQKEQDKMTFKEVERMLGFNILNLEKYYDQEINYGTIANQNGKVKKIHITTYMNNDIEEDCLYVEEINREFCNYLNFDIEILTQHADTSDFKIIEEKITTAGGKNLKETYHSKNLDIDIVFYTRGDYKTEYSAIFTYDDILYTIGGYGATREKLIEIIENLK